MSAQAPLLRTRRDGPAGPAGAPRDRAGGPPRVAAPAGGGESVVILSSYAPSLIGFRRELIAAMVGRGHRVTACAPGAAPDLVASLAGLGAAYRHVPLARTALGPAADLASLAALVGLFRSLRPTVVLAYTAKAVIYGSIAARIAGVPRACSMIEGAGFAFGEGREPRRRLVRAALTPLYRVALAGNARVLFLNPDDRALFAGLGMLREPDRQAVLIDGCGVDLDHYAEAPPVTAPSFVMLARLIAEKGVREYAEAARIVRARHPAARFRLAGWIDAGGAGSIRPDELAAWEREGTIEYLGVLDDVRPAIAGCAAYVLPSYYREGTPRSSLEALAMGRPIVTTDSPGCRETVEHGVNGFLVPPRDPGALADALLRLIEQPGLIAAMGTASRALARRRYDVHAVNRVILDALEL